MAKLNVSVFTVFVAVLVLSACETNQKAPPARKVLSVPQVEIKQGGNAQARFDPENVPAEVKEAVKNDIVDYINELNNIIRRRDYREWTKRITATYQRHLSWPENLERASEADRLKKNNVKLQNLYDYFIHVVVPSRDHDRVDDIEFVKEDRVKAYTVDRNSRRLRLYELERSGDTWIIVN